MTRALVWKELREQWAVWLALALAAAGGMTGLAWLLAPSLLRDQMLAWTLWLSAWGYGLVCGALLLAGETEDGTHAFLDTLPVTRRRLWAVKAATGLFLLAAQTGFLLAVGFAVARQPLIRGREALDAAGVLWGGAVGYGWGLFCGSYAANVLGAVSRAVFLQALAAALVAPAVLLALLALTGGVSGPRQPVSLMVVLGLVTAGAALRSRAIYCLPDGPRGAGPMSSARETLRRWREAIRQAAREARGFALGMAVVGLAGMAAVILLGVAVWPVLTLVIGVACGVSVFAGVRPFPAGRALPARAVVRFAVGLTAAAITALGPIAVVVETMETVPQENLTGFGTVVGQSVATDLVTQPTVFLALWLVYGYAIGLLSGLLAGRRVLAAVVATLVAVPVGALWVPSVFVGGPLHAWQVWGPPALLLAGAAVLVQARAAGRPLTRGELGVAAASPLAAGALLAAGLAYRAFEIPPAPDAVDLAAFRDRLPGPGENEAGRLALAALRRWVTIEQTVIGAKLPGSVEPLPTPARPLLRTTPGAYAQQAAEVGRRGWETPDVLGVGVALDVLFADVWARNLAESAGHPTGVVTDPRETTFRSRDPELQAAKAAADLLVARGLQRQADGDPAAFVDHLRTGLALARNLRHQTVSTSVFYGARAESALARGVERWLERLDGRPDLLRRALDELQRHAAEPPADPEEVRQAQLLVALNSFADPTDLLIGRGTDPFFRSAAIDTAPALGLAWRAPWERFRLRRALDSLASGDSASKESAKRLAPPVARQSGLFWRTDTRSARSDVAAALLQVALRLYQAEVGRPAERLDDLVPGHLSAVPADPFDGRPFRYRLSAGETLNWPAEPRGGAGPVDDSVRAVPAGQGILWSTGEDGRDDGGHNQRGTRAWNGATGEDVIFLVPLPPTKR